MRGLWKSPLRAAGAALCVIALSGCATSPPANPYADRIVVEKAKRQMHLVQGDKVLKTYPIALGMNPRGHKQYEGDQRTPEGLYSIDLRRPESRFNLALRISYPNATDRQIAQSRGLSPGGEIYIHGQPNNGIHPARLAAGPDWTDGCIAVTNGQMSEIWAMVQLGTPIEIRP
jgi:murein L,D-transpeptidase YafK